MAAFIHHPGRKRQLDDAVFLKSHYLLRSINEANLSDIHSEAKDQLPRRNAAKESAQILTISCVSLLWISAIIAPHVDTCRRAQIDVFVRAAAAVAGFYTLTGVRF